MSSFEYHYALPPDSAGIVFSQKKREITCGCGVTFTTECGNKSAMIRCKVCRVARRKVVAARTNAKRALKRRGLLEPKSGFGK